MNNQYDKYYNVKDYLLKFALEYNDNKESEVIPFLKCSLEHGEFNSAGYAPFTTIDVRNFYFQFHNEIEDYFFDCYGANYLQELSKKNTDIDSLIFTMVENYTLYVISFLTGK